VVTTAARTRIRVVVADDNELCAEALADTVTAAGFSVVGIASSGEAACEAVEQLEPDLVLLDVRMPGMGGIAAAELIRERWPQTAVLLVSATHAGDGSGVIRKETLTPSRLHQLWRTCVYTAPSAAAAG
jgi:CheY-like chemotaxis protein